MKNRINCWAHCIRLKAVAKTKKRGPCRPRKDEIEDLIYTLDTGQVHFDTIVSIAFSTFRFSTDVL